MDENTGPERWLADGLPYVSFNQLRSFHAVALTGSVTAAARLLHVGQPTVTTQLRQLESSYKVELALRLPTGVKLTDMGRRLFALTENMFHLQSEAVDLLRQVEGNLHGTLRVGSVAPYFIMRTLASFNDEYPDVAIDLTLNDSATIAQKVADCEVDVAIVGHLGLDSRYLSMPFSRQDLVVFVPSSHPWAHRGGITLRELGTSQLIMRKGGSASRRVLETALIRAGIQPQVALEVDREGALEAVRAGLGVAVATTAEIIPDENFRVLGITDIDLHTDAFVICLEARRSSPMVGSFLRTAARFRHETVTGVGRRRTAPLVGLPASS
jgi:aminoethylphosphonate catabolism LysR family transcriptional regulator